MRYKLVAMDMDGTLLNNQHEIPKENIEVIKKLKEKGVEFLVVTGRPDTMVKEYIELLEITAPVIGSNGASIRDVLTKELYCVKNMEQEILLKIYNFFTHKNLYPRFYSLDEVYTFNKEEFDEEKNPFINSVKKLSKKMEYKIIETPEHLCKEGNKIIKITYPSYDEELLSSLQEELKSIEEIEIVKGTKYTLDIMAKNVSKGNTLSEYLEKIGISREEVVAIGDGENDISMLEIVGYPVTLENGEEELKKIARMITLENKDAGVAHALRKIFKCYF